MKMSSKKITKKRLVLIDSHALVHRAFHALPPLNTTQGELVNAVFGFFSIFLSALKELRPEYVAAAFDLPKPTFRHEQYAEYKATRVKAPDELYNQIGRVKEGLLAFNVPILEKEGFEADDVLGTIVQQLKDEKDLEVFIVTGDLDTLQLVGQNVKVFTLKRGIKDTQIYDVQKVKERFSLPPEKMVDFKGLKGDPSDNIPGVPGVGDKTAAGILQQVQNLEELYAKLEKLKLPEKLKAKLREHKDQAFFSRELAAIKKDVPLDFSLEAARWSDFDRTKVREFLASLRFATLQKRLDEILGEKTEVVQEEKKEVGDKADPVLAEIEELYQQKIFSSQIYQTEKELLPVIRSIEQAGILLDKKRLEKVGLKVGGELKKLEKEIYHLAGSHFNINSPQQLSQVLFEKLKIDTKGLKKTPGKVISTAFGELAKLKAAHPVIKKIIKFRELAKLKNTYIDSLPKLVGADGRLHTHFFQLGTTTGRLSSKEPNLQNIPVKSKLGNEIRQAFVAAPGKTLLAADYSQIELRVVASIAKDKEMIRLLKAGHDIHTATAAAVFKVSEKKVTPRQRKAAKVLNFGMIYGMSIAGFAQAAGLSRSEAKEFMNNYFKTFAGVASYIEKIKKEVARRGFVETIFGRRRFIPEINSSAWNLRAAAERMAVNMPVQGTAADIIKMAMVRTAKVLRRAGLTQQVKMILQVHDELVFEVDNQKLAEAEKIVKEQMEGAAKLSVPLKVEFKKGQRWGELD